MTRITNADHVLVLLRNHLERAQRARGRNGGAAELRQLAPQGAVARVKQMASGDQLSDAELKRALVAGILAEEFGPAVASSAGFQIVVDEVVGTIQRDASSAALLEGAVAQMTRDD